MPRLRISCAFLLSMCGLAQAADWPHWRGPDRNGISRETGLLQTWPAGGPPLAWKAEGLGNGYSSLAVVGSRLYTQGQKGREQYVMAIDAATGKQLWKTTTAKNYENDRGSGPRGTPTVDGKRVYAMGGEGTVVCLDADTGKEIWKLSVVEQFRGREPHWGYSESPLVWQDRVIVNAGGSGASVVALDKNNGNLIWKSQSDRPGYSSAVPYDLGGAPKLVVFSGEGAMGLGMKNGELLWRYDKVSNRTANIATPIVQKDQIFLSSDYGTGCALLKLTASGGSEAASEVYFNREMRNHYTSSVLIGEHLYGFSSAILTAMKWSTGEVAWKDRSVGKGHCIVADQRLYCTGENGAVALIEPNPSAYKEVSRFQITKGNLPMWAVPVVANGRLYVRDQDTLYSYNIRRSK